MSPATALLDANVLYSAQLRDIFLQLGRDGLYRAKWTDAIQNEWINALLKNQPHLNRAEMECLRNTMDSSLRDPVVVGYEYLVNQLTLPDPDDRHVLAAAIFGDCNWLVIFNTRHFPKRVLASYALQAIGPDEFLVNLLLANPTGFCTSLRSILARLQNPPYTFAEYLTNLEQHSLVRTATELKQYGQLLE